MSVLPKKAFTMDGVPLHTPELSPNPAVMRAARELARHIHPDVCQQPWAEEAMRHLNAIQELVHSTYQGTASSPFTSAPNPIFPGRTADDGPDVSLRVTISPAEAAAGTQFTKTYHGPTGYPYSLTFIIPGGIRSGTQLRLRGAGVRGRAGGKDGDVVLTVLVSE